MIPGKTETTSRVNRRMLTESVVPVSVIIPCWRCIHTIHRAMQSVVNQTVRPAEVIIVDDASGSPTSAVLSRLSRQYNRLLNDGVKVVALARQSGPALARNRGWELASHPLLAFLDADDAWHPNKLEIQYAYMNAHSYVALSGHRTICLKPGQEPPSLPERWIIKRISAAQQLIANRFHTRSVMVRRDIPYCFDPAKRAAEDYLLWTEILCNRLTGIHIDLPLAFAYKPQYGASGLSGDLWKMEKGELDTYLRLYEKKLISFSQLVALMPFSFVKYVKRTVVATCRRKQRNS